VGHSRSDAGAYRPAGELVGAGVDPTTLDGIDTEIEALQKEMERRGLEAPFPEPRPWREFSG
jgi:hypothetical protein